MHYMNQTRKSKILPIERMEINIGATKYLPFQSANLKCLKFSSFFIFQKIPKQAESKASNFVPTE
jgi:hypothetical protein